MKSTCRRLRFNWERIRGQACPVALALLLTALLAGSLLAQTNQGSISGTVTDASGAVVPGVKITAREVAPGTVYNTVSSSAGGYTFSNVRLGTYDLSAEFSRFKKWQSTGSLVKIKATSSPGIGLHPRSTTVTVTVEGSPT